MTSSSNSRRTPSTPNPPSLKKTSSSQSSKNQKSIVGFFQKRSALTSPSSTQLASTNPSVQSDKSNSVKKVARGLSQSLTPAPSSDALEEDSSDDRAETKEQSAEKDNGLPSPITPVSDAAAGNITPSTIKVTLNYNSPSRKVSSFIIIILPN